MRNVAVWLFGVIAICSFATSESLSQSNAPGLSPWPTSGLPQVSSNPHLLMSSHLVASGFQQTVLVDSDHRTMAVYHIHPDTGVIALKSVRRLEADFAIEEFNSADPTPSKIRNILPTTSR